MYTLSARTGHRATPVFVFVGIVVLSLVFFFALTLPRQLERKKRAAPERSDVPAATETAHRRRGQSQGRYRKW